MRITGTVTCYGHHEQTCFVTDDGLFYDYIKGFVYESGHEYVLIITEKLVYDYDDLLYLADVSAFSYTLKEVVSKISSAVGPVEEVDE